MVPSPCSQDTIPTFSAPYFSIRLRIWSVLPVEKAPKSAIFVVSLKPLLMVCLPLSIYAHRRFVSSIIFRSAPHALGPVLEPVKWAVVLRLRLVGPQVKILRWAAVDTLHLAAPGAEMHQHPARAPLPVARPVAIRWHLAGPVRVSEM